MSKCIDQEYRTCGSSWLYSVAYMRTANVDHMYASESYIDVGFCIKLRKLP